MTAPGLRTRVSFALTALALVVGSLSFAPHAVAGTKADAAKPADDSWTQTKTLTRTFGNGTPTDTRSVDVTADKHTNLQDHERITVAWSGAHATGGRALNPFGENGLGQEYPVLLMECRGIDPINGDVPADQEQVLPSTCWTNTQLERTQYAAPGEGIWQHDADATEADKAHVSGIDSSDIPDNCNVTSAFDWHITPFVAADGTLFPGCSAQSMPPEATVNSVSIPNEVFAFSNSAGDGTAQFEVRTDVENESLGCSEDVPCTLEVIPIDGINCAPTDDSTACNATGSLPSGQVNNAGKAPDDAVAAAYWWSASNWDRRFAVPLTFAPPPSVCQLSTASGSPVPFYGSELMSQAALQWTPAYCLNPKRFNWQDNIMADDAAFGLMQNGQAAAALVSGKRDGSDVGYAPTGVTGWGIAFDIDKPNNAGQQMTLNLNARLLAKLLTESYPGGPAIRMTHPGFATNPLSLNLDPEFIKLNPGLDTRNFGEAQAALLALSTSTDVISQITSYIASDPAAMAFIHGKPDPYGMKVNPYYKNISLPVATWPLLDTWVPKDPGNGCLSQSPTAYMPLIASPVSSFRLIATAMLYNWPYVSTQCNGIGTSDQPYAIGRVSPQGLGNRFMLGIVTLADAQRYGLTVAKLQASPGHFVAADDAGLTSALKLAKQSGPQQPFTIDESDVRKTKDAYPGTMVVYTAAKTTGLDKSDAQDVAQFIDISTTEGQDPGRGNGQLPAGYLPIEKNGPTAKLYDSAQVVRRAILAQSGTPGDDDTTTGGGGSTTGGSTGGTGDTGGTGAVVPPTDVQTAPPSDGSSQPSAPTTEAPTVATAAVTSQVGGGLLPVLLVVGIGAALATGAVRLGLRMKGYRS